MEKGLVGKIELKRIKVVYESNSAAFRVPAVAF